jgi:hypothetical protein
MAMTASAALAHADTFVVTTNADAGTGSLRQAMLDANAKQTTDGSHCARHLITFAIPGAGPHTIQPLSALPKINIPITFDGYTQPGSSENTLTVGSNAVIAIELDGSLAGNADAFVVGPLRAILPEIAVHGCLPSRLNDPRAPLTSIRPWDRSVPSSRALDRVQARRGRTPPIPPVA